MKAGSATEQSSRERCLCRGGTPNPERWGPTSQLAAALRDSGLVPQPEAPFGYAIQSGPAGPSESSAHASRPASWCNPLGRCCPGIHTSG